VHHASYIVASRRSWFSLAPPATSALCIASHRKAMLHSRSDVEGAGVAAQQPPVG